MTIKVASELPVIVRSIVVSDMADIVELCREHAAYEAAAYVECDQRERLERALFAEQPKLYGWVAETQGKIVGYMTVTIDFSTWDAMPFAHMDCLYLRQAYRNAGIGRCFFVVLSRFAVAMSCQTIQWQTPANNALAIGFYKALGATGRTKQRFYYEIGKTL